MQNLNYAHALQQRSSSEIPLYVNLKLVMQGALIKLLVYAIAFMAQRVGIEELKGVYKVQMYTFHYNKKRYTLKVFLFCAKPLICAVLYLCS